MTSAAGRARPLRIVQWTTGNVAREAVRAVTSRADMEMVGAFAHSAHKEGVDVGTLCGLDDELGVTATRDVDELLGRDVDCVVYTPLHFDSGDVARILRAGIDVVTSAEFLTGRNLPVAERDDLAAAAADGGATLFGSGANPGYMQMLAGVITGVSTSVTRATVTESVDVSLFIGDANFAGVGWGRPRDSPGHAEDVEKATEVFAEGVEALALLMGTELDDIVCDVEFAYGTEDLVADGVEIREGCVAAMTVDWHGRVGGDTVISTRQRWLATTALDRPWEAEHAYLIDIVGDPNIRVRLDLVPTEADLADLTPDRMRGIGLRITAAPLVNAIPAVCAAPAGIVTFADLRTPAARLRR
ncbi:MAG: dihydrodipicolinate reductase [Williamsia herbipolensis]|nr:dihydrodipicolinate reductase [Williamsia herbipolensis]